MLHYRNHIICIINANKLILFGEIINMYSGTNTSVINRPWIEFSGSTYSNCSLKDKVDLFLCLVFEILKFRSFVVFVIALL